MLDFTEIRTGDAFEDLIEELFTRKSMKPIRSGEGPDRGRDFLVTEHMEGAVSATSKKWVVECKHGAFSKRSVSERDVGMIPGIVAKHRADGYLLVTSTRPTINLEESLRAINDDPRYPIWTKCWSPVDIERELTPFPDLLQKYFPVSSAAAPLSTAHWADLRGRAQIAVTAEIQAAVGTKYIPAIYVNRTVSQSTHSFLQATAAAIDSVSVITQSLGELVGATHNALSKRLHALTAFLTTSAQSQLQELKLPFPLQPLSESIEAVVSHTSQLKETISNAQEARKLQKGDRDASEEVTPGDVSITSLQQQVTKLNDYLITLRNLDEAEHAAVALDDNMHTSLERLTRETHSLKHSRFAHVTYPSHELFFGLDQISNRIKESIQEVTVVSDKSLALDTKPGAVRQTTESLLNRLREIDNQVRQARKATRPVYLLVDRAGGGKTNLLCRLAEEAASTGLCFFVTAKSIVNTSVDCISEYIDATYKFSQPGKSAIRTCMEWCSQSRQPLVVIIDGINESISPIAFNASLKVLVKSCYNCDVRFVVSCRDVYWQYFRDAFWDEHALIESGSLYVFSMEEYKRAIQQYMSYFHIKGRIEAAAREQLRHPLLLRFFCEAYKGVSELSPSSVDTVDSIRLKRLFDDYSERKFFEIRRRLNLSDARDIEEYLFMIVEMMLDRTSRLVPSEQIKTQARSRFGEHSISSLTSRYVQILDEDIILEEKPVGALHSLRTGFVYDEFMEYMIAKWCIAKIAEVDPSANDFVAVTAEAMSKLLSKRRSFISVVGAVEYLLTLVAEINTRFACGLIEHLVAEGMTVIACRAVSKWPPELVTEAVYCAMVEIHGTAEAGDEAERLAWKALESNCPAFPENGLIYAMGLEISTVRRPAVLFSFVGRACAGLCDVDLLRRCIVWTVDTMIGSPFVFIGDAGSADYRSGAKTLRILVGGMADRLDEVQRAELWQRVAPLFQASLEVCDRSIRENLKAVFKGVRNRSVSYRKSRSAWS